MGALFGEAVVIANETFKRDFRYSIKQHGGMLAKGRLLGVQFDALFTDNLYFDISIHAIKMADQLRDCFDSLDVPYLVPGITNQIFPILSDKCLEQLAKEFPKEVVEAVALLTHGDGVDYFDYVRAIKDNPVAKAVKLADLRHNSDLTRMDTVDDEARARVEKYKKAGEM